MGEEQIVARTLKQEKDLETEEPDTENIVLIEPEKGNLQKEIEESAKPQIKVEETQMSHKTISSQYEIKFNMIGYENRIITLMIPEKEIVTLGRNQKADRILNPNDRRLSSVQCKVRCMQNVIHIWDMNSQNGTFVNGIPIKQIGMATVQNGDIVRMGSYEYRVLITKK